MLVPSAFWQGIGPIVLGDRQPTLLYPARGVELMWQIERARSGALAGVLGATRARLLAELEQPVTTTELARRLGLAAPGLSQHLQRLRDAGLTRDGREVRYQRTPLLQPSSYAPPPLLADLPQGRARSTPAPPRRERLCVVHSYVPWTHADCPALTVGLMSEPSHRAVRNELQSQHSPSLGEQHHANVPKP